MKILVVLGKSNYLKEIRKVDIYKRLISHKDFNFTIKDCPILVSVDSSGENYSTFSGKDDACDEFAGKIGDKHYYIMLVHPSDTTKDMLKDKNNLWFVHDGDKDDLKKNLKINEEKDSPNLQIFTGAGPGPGEGTISWEDFCKKFKKVVESVGQDGFREAMADLVGYSLDDLCIFAKLLFLPKSLNCKVEVDDKDYEDIEEAIENRKAINIEDEKEKLKNLLQNVQDLKTKFIEQNYEKLVEDPFQLISNDA